MGTTRRYSVVKKIVRLGAISSHQIVRNQSIIPLEFNLSGHMWIESIFWHCWPLATTGTPPRGMRGEDNRITFSATIAATALHAPPHNGNPSPPPPPSPPPSTHRMTRMSDDDSYSVQSVGRRSLLHYPGQPSALIARTALTQNYLF